MSSFLSPSPKHPLQTTLSTRTRMCFHEEIRTLRLTAAECVLCHLLTRAGGPRGRTEHVQLTHTTASVSLVPRGTLAGVVHPCPWMALSPHVTCVAPVVARIHADGV